eukprot:1481765-Rhodomonas_salina.1
MVKSTKVPPFSWQVDSLRVPIPRAHCEMNKNVNFPCGNLVQTVYPWLAIDRNSQRVSIASTGP